MLFVPPSMPFMVPEAEAATYTIEMTETGFSQTTITIQVGDSLRFLNTHVIAGNPEPHCISDPESIAATEQSCWIVSDSELSRTFSSGEINFGNPGTEKFYDRSFVGYPCANEDWHCADADPVIVTILPPPDTTPPTINFFVNSPLGTVSIQPVAGGGFERLAYIATDSSGYYLKLYVDVSDDTSGAWLNQNASGCQVSGLTQEQETDSFNNGELIDMNIRDEDGQIIAGNNPMLLSSGPLNGNSGSGDYHYYQFPINGFEQGNIDYNDYYGIYCSTTDPAGNFIAQSFLLTVIPESGQTEKPCWSDYCDNIVPTSDTTPPVVNMPDNQYFSITDLSGLYYTWIGATATDDVTPVGGLVITCHSVGESGSENSHSAIGGTTYLGFGTTTFTCTATDWAYNVGTASFTVTVVLEGLPYCLIDNSCPTPPVVTVPSNSTSYSTSNSAGKTVTFSVTASDDIGVTSGPTCSPSSGSLFPIGTTTVTCTATNAATDAAGNVGTASFTVTITFEGTADTTPPTMAASAYLNSTSATDRTLAITVGNFDTGEVMTQWTIQKLGVIQPNEPYGSANSPDGYRATSGMGHEGIGDNQVVLIEIPTNWVAGTYDIVWTVTCLDMSIPGWPPCFTEYSASFTIPALPGQEETEIVIPSWIKNNAGWWASNQIDDRSFVSGLQWLISNGIMNIPPTEQGAGSDDVIPSWIKNNAGWWADDLIDDRNFVTGLQWLITNGIMIIG